MAKIFTYVRVNKNNNEYTKKQIEAIDNFINEKNLNISKKIEIEISTPKEEKNILELLKNCEKNSTIIVSDLNVFGRSINAIVEIIKFLISNKIKIIAIKQNLELIDDQLSHMVLAIVSMTVNLEKDLISLRTKEALNAKKLSGASLGKPKGTIQKSKFDKQRDKIEELLSIGLSVRKISKILGYSNHIGLNNYVKKRNIRENLPNTLDIAS